MFEPPPDHVIREFVVRTLNYGYDRQQVIDKADVKWPGLGLTLDDVQQYEDRHIEMMRGVMDRPAADLVARKLASMATVRQGAWDEWEKRGELRRKDVMGKEGDVVTLYEEIEADPRWLQVVMQAEDRECKLLGIEDGVEQKAKGEPVDWASFFLGGLAAAQGGGPRQVEATTPALTDENDPIKAELAYLNSLPRPQPNTLPEGELRADVQGDTA